MHLTVEELFRYTDEERAGWERWFRENGEELLKMPVAGERDSTIGAVVLYIFGQELRYVERLTAQPLSEYRTRPCASVAELFGFGIESRTALREFVLTLQTADWNQVLKMDHREDHRPVSVRKIVLHTLLQEVRYWAQIARLMRERGFLPPPDHNLLVSDALP